MIKYFFNKIIIFCSLFFGFDIPKIKNDSSKILSPIITDSREEEKKQLHKFLISECVAYDPNSPEAIEELKVMKEMIGKVKDSDFHEIKNGNDELRNHLIGKIS